MSSLETGMSEFRGLFCLFENVGVSHLNGSNIQKVCYRKNVSHAHNFRELICRKVSATMLPIEKWLLKIKVMNHKNSTRYNYFHSYKLSYLFQKHLSKAFCEGKQ